MARPLIFQLDDQQFSVTLNKVDRSRLYGYKEVEVLDASGRPCELATLAGDGRTVVGRGGTGVGYLSADGRWCDRAQLTPVDVEGNEIAPVESSFGAPVVLSQTVSCDEYLEHNIRLVYVLIGDEQTQPLMDALATGVIFKFPYSFRGGLQSDAGFLLLGNDGNAFLAVCDPTKVELIGLRQPAAVVEEEGEAEETDLMDFDMI